MKKTILFLGVVMLSCSSFKYTRKAFFDQKPHEYQMNSDVKTLIYLCLERAVVNEKDIPDYSLIADKTHIYVHNVFYLENGGFVTPEELNSSPVVIEENDIPAQISGVKFCLKSKPELQDIANQSRQDFMYINFNLIIIDNEKAFIQVSNKWMVNQNSNTSYLSGGAYSCLFKKINGRWVFDKIAKMIIS